jgi:peptidoglycan/LPS O-acetylase OafA/YrhL
VSVEESELPPDAAAAAGGPARGPGPASATPDPVKKERDFRPDIQGMRALAVVMVVVYHLYPSALPGGFVGVDVFFVISGFLITGHLLREYRATGTVAVLGFWGRRAKRLMPAAVLVLTVTWVASRFVLPVTRLADTATQIRASALYFQNWQLAGDAVNYLKADSAATPVQHFWSLSVEEQFYLGWPLLFLLVALAAGSRRRRTEVAPELQRARVVRGGRLLLLLAVAVVAASLWYSAYYTGVNPGAAYFVTTTRIWELALGGLLALLPAQVTGRLSRLGVLGWAGLGLVIASAFLLSGSSAFPGLVALMPAGGAAVLILGGSAEARFGWPRLGQNRFGWHRLGSRRLGPDRLTSLPPLVFIGGISYSLYLWHWPLISLWTAWQGHGPGPYSGPGIAAVAVALSWLTKVYVEDRVRTARLLAGHNWRSVSVALAAVIPVVLVATYLATRPGPWNEPLQPGYPGAGALANSLTTVTPEPFVPPVNRISLPEYWQQGCLVAESSPAPKECVYGDTKDPVLTVALVGDSLAGDWFTPLKQIADERHWKLVTELHSVCPLTSTMMIYPDVGGPYTACHDWGTAVMHDLETSIHPDVVITSDYPGLATPADPSGGAVAQADIGDGMADYWKQLESAGASVVAIKETPDMVINIPDCVANNPRSLDICAMPVVRAIKPDVPTLYATEAANGTVPLVDMNSLLCGPASCPPVIGNVLVYQDNHHLTSTYALTTAPYLEQRLLQVCKALNRK